MPNDRRFTGYVNMIARCRPHGTAQTRRAYYVPNAYFVDESMKEDFNERTRLSCGCPAMSRPVWGKRSEGKSCNRGCWLATTVKCVCECGGEQHGSMHSDDYLQAVNQ